METINYKTISEPLSYREMMGVKGGNDPAGLGGSGKTCCWKKANCVPEWPCTKHEDCSAGGADMECI